MAEVDYRCPMGLYNMEDCNDCICGQRGNMVKEYTYDDSELAMEAIEQAKEAYKQEVGTGCMVNSPDHYTVGGYEAIHVIKAKLTPEEYRGYLKGAALKYLMRANYKDHHNQDIEKCAWYIDELTRFLNEEVR